MNSEFNMGSATTHGNTLCCGASELHQLKTSVEILSGLLKLANTRIDDLSEQFVTLQQQLTELQQGK